MRKLLLTALLFAGLAQAQTDIVLDNVAPAFATTGTWPASTAVTGYVGTNYQSHAPNGAPPGALVVDNTDAGFSVSGTWPASGSVTGYVGTNYQVHSPNGEPPTAIVADNSAGTAVGTWPVSTAVSGYYGTSYQPHAAGTGSESFTWTLNVAAAGTYAVYARWTAHPNRASNAKYTVTHAAGQDTVTMNQQANSAAWQLVGTYSFDAGAATVSLSDEANGYVIADAVMLAPPGAAPNTATWSFSVPSSARRGLRALECNILEMMDEPIHPVQLEALKRATPAQKIEAVAALYAAGIRLRMAGLRMSHPDWPDDRLELEARRSLRHAGT